MEIRFALLTSASLRYFLLIIHVFIGVCATAQQQTRVTLLRGITDVPLPDTPNHICATLIFSHKPEIITTASDGKGTFQFNNIVTTSLGKGKIIILGSLEYFSALMLKKNNTRQLLQNMVLWGSLKKTAKIQLWTQSEALQKFFEEQHFSIVSNEGNKIDPSTNILVLTKDVVDSVNMKGIEMFVRRGGTLIFGSSLADMLKENPQAYPSLHLNDLFFKAGVFHYFNPFAYQVKNNTLKEGFPYYLHINTILKKLSENYHYRDKMEREIVISTVSLAIYIGYHHIHHINSRIPFYRLPEVMASIPQLQAAKTTTLNPRDIVACFRLKVWDPAINSMAGLK